MNVEISLSFWISRSGLFVNFRSEPEEWLPQLFCQEHQKLPRNYMPGIKVFNEHSHWTFAMWATWELRTSDPNRQARQGRLGAAPAGVRSGSQAVSTGGPEVSSASVIFWRVYSTIRNHSLVLLLFTRSDSSDKTSGNVPSQLSLKASNFRTTEIVSRGRFGLQLWGSKEASDH